MVLQCLCSLENDLLQNFDWCLQETFQLIYFHRMNQNIQNLFERGMVS